MTPVAETLKIVLVILPSLLPVQELHSVVSKRSFLPYEFIQVSYERRSCL